MTATLAVVPGEILNVFVGGQGGTGGTAGFNGGGAGGDGFGGGGGGASDIRRGGTALVVAGGGGGARHPSSGSPAAQEGAQRVALVQPPDAAGVGPAVAVARSWMVDGAESTSHPLAAMGSPESPAPAARADPTANAASGGGGGGGYFGGGGGAGGTGRF